MNAKQRLIYLLSMRQFSIYEQAELWEISVRSLFADIRFGRKSLRMNIVSHGMGWYENSTPLTLAGVSNCQITSVAIAKEEPMNIERE